MKVYGIAYHSPLDVVTLLPNEIKVTLDPESEADVFFSQDTSSNCKTPVQVVFASPRLLVSNDIKIIDQGSRGQILNIRRVNWKKILA